MKVGPERGRVH